MGVEDETESPDIKPGVFEPKKRIKWSRLFEVYLSSQRGRFGLSSYYIICKPLPTGQVAVGPREIAKYERLLAGPEYEADNNWVYQLLFELVNSTDG